MKRRTLIAAFGGLTASSVFAVGSGAFTSVEAARTVTVKTADDNDALLALSELGEGSGRIGGRSNKGGDTVSFSFPGVDRRLSDPELGLGVDSVYEFTQDSGESDTAAPTQGLARITNQGTQPAEVYSTHEVDHGIEVELFDATDPDRTALRQAPAELTVGDHVDIGVRIRTLDADVGEFQETLTLVADQPDE